MPMQNEAVSVLCITESDFFGFNMQLFPVRFNPLLADLMWE